MTTPAPLAIQLYTVRDLLAGDVPGTLQQIAQAGYLGVEPFGLNADSARQQAAIIADLGLAVPSVHGMLPLGDNRAEMLDIMGLLGTQRVCVSRKADQFTALDDIKRICDDLNEAASVAADEGVSIGYHNHWWEFLPVADTGKTGYAIMLELLDPAVQLQVDTYWVKTGGHDPVAVVAQVADRAPTLHIKDGPATREADMVAVGSGVLDFPAIIAAGKAEWLIVELDRCATDMMTAVRESYAYLTGKGLARGRN